MDSPDKPLKGAARIAAYLKTLPDAPGVYRMMNAAGDVLYVGKAKSLKKRVSSYALRGAHNERISRMIAETAEMLFLTTESETEALLLESNLIKRLKPRYNVSYRDDKSFPNILLREDHPFPQLLKHRGAKTIKGVYFGPFASAGAVNRTLNTLQRAFLLRSCSDSVFESRTRPCLLFQIKRCSAPCVNRIDSTGYHELVEEAEAFLHGKSQTVQNQLKAEMTKASDVLDFEAAAKLRDRLKAMSNIQSSQGVNPSTFEEADLFAAYSEGGHTCIQVFFFRAGQNLGNRSYFPSQTASLPPEEILEAFVGQFYAGHPPPRLILTSHKLPGAELMAEALALKADRKVAIGMPERGSKRKLIEHALSNAAQALARRMAESATQRKLLEGVGEVFGLDGTPERIEVYDNSHISGTNAIGAMIVAGPEGLIKNAWRKFNIRTVAPTGHTENSQGGDDYAMMREVLTRRFARALKEDPERNKGQWPDLVLIDGGAGQLAQASAVLAELGVQGVTVVGVAKGEERRAGHETLVFPDGRELQPGVESPGLQLIQQVRDEAHRFAITGHRGRRAKARETSRLEDIAGIGPRRRANLLKHFGGLSGLKNAGVEEIARVDGVNLALANRIYASLHGLDLPNATQPP
jgi:excinuclease ABC subunit C